MVIVTDQWLSLSLTCHWLFTSLVVNVTDCHFVSYVYIKLICLFRVMTTLCFNSIERDPWGKNFGVSPEETRIKEVNDCETIIGSFYYEHVL